MDPHHTTPLHRRSARAGSAASIDGCLDCAVLQSGTGAGAPQAEVDARPHTGGAIHGTMTSCCCCRRCCACCGCCCAVLPAQAAQAACREGAHSGAHSRLSHAATSLPTGCTALGQAGKPLMPRLCQGRHARSPLAHRAKQCHAVTQSKAEVRVNRSGPSGSISKPPAKQILSPCQ